MKSEGWLGIWIAALGAGSVFSAIAQSLRDLSRPSMDTLLERRANPALTARIQAILGAWDAHATAIALPRVGLNLVVVLAMAFWLATLTDRAAPGWLEVTISVVASSFLIWLFGWIVPCAIAKHAAEGTVVAWSPVIRAVSWLASPLRPVAMLMDTSIRRLAGRGEVDTAEQVQDEILSVVEEARHEGQVDETERDMIAAVVRFRDATVAQIMTPRTEIEALELTNNLGLVTQLIRKGGKSRVPVYEGSLDHILGVFYVKDLMRWLAGERAGANRGFDLKSLLRPAIFVPETKTVRELLDEFKERHVHIAIVADEYGGTAGLVTIEDIVEEIFGDIRDEYEAMKDESPDARVDLAAGTAELDARSYIEDLNHAIKDLGVQIPESPDYDTLGGFVTVTLGRIPASGEIIEAEGLTLTILEAEPTRVNRVLIRPRGVGVPTPDQTPDATSITQPDGGTPVVKRSGSAA